MTHDELKKKISKLEKDIEELELDLYYSRYNVTQKLIKREIVTNKHVLKQYKEMLDMITM